jgi:hypothetical protein
MWRTTRRNTPVLTHPASDAALASTQPAKGWHQPDATPTSPDTRLTPLLAHPHTRPARHPAHRRTRSPHRRLIPHALSQAFAYPARTSAHPSQHPAPLPHRELASPQHTPNRHPRRPCPGSRPAPCNPGSPAIPAPPATPAPRTPGSPCNPGSRSAPMRSRHPCGPGTRLTRHAPLANPGSCFDTAHPHPHHPSRGALLPGIADPVAHSGPDGPVLARCWKAAARARPGITAVTTSPDTALLAISRSERPLGRTSLVG